MEIGNQGIRVLSSTERSASSCLGNFASRTPGIPDGSPAGPGGVSARKILRMKKFLLALLLIPCLSHANQAFRAYDATPIFGPSREVVRENDHFVYRFPYRGGTVSYRPGSGSEWSGGTNPARESNSPAGFGKSNRIASLPNGCMVYACARAEEIRRNGGASGKSQVIGYKCADGAGHAIVVFEKGGRFIAEDDRGFRLPVQAWTSRSTAEALAIARDFQQRTYPSGYAAPVRASFIGQF